MPLQSRLLRQFASLIFASGLGFAAAFAGAADPAPLRVKVFQGAQNLPIYVGIEKGIFAKHGVKVELQYTRSSTELRNGLAAGDFEIAVSGVDNAVALVEVAGKDVIIVMGGDSSMNEFLVQSEIGSVAELRGKTLVVDAPNTAYAILAKKILLNNGLREGDYAVKPVGGSTQRLKAMLDNKENAAVVLGVPFSILAVQNGLKSLGRTVDLLGPYQANGAYVMRAWAQANAQTLERYIAGYVESLRWAMQPANRAECVAMLVERLKLAPEVAERAYDLLREPKFGLDPDARFNPDGFKNLLALRAEFEGPAGASPPTQEKYIDLSYYQRAIAALAR